METLTRPAPPRQDEVVVIKLWEIYLLYHPANLYRILTHYSLDNGPAYDEKASGRVVFRFNKALWEDKIKNLLYENRIPVVLKSNAMNTVRVKGRQPVLR
jgi:hypothetical protein